MSTPDTVVPVARTERWPGPNGGRWEIRTQEFPPMSTVKGTQCVQAQTLDTLWFVAADGTEQELFHTVTGYGPNHDHIMVDGWVRMHDTARRQTTAPHLIPVPPVGARVKVLSSGEEGIVDSHCIHVNEWRGSPGECYARGRFSAFVVQLADRVVVAFPEEVTMVLVIDQCEPRTVSTQRAESANEPPPKPQPKQLVKSIYCGGFLRRPVTDISRAFDATEDD